MSTVEKVASSASAAIPVVDALSDTARVKRCASATGTTDATSSSSSSTTCFSSLSSKATVEESSEGPLLWKKRVTVNDWPCLEWNMQKWSSQLNEAIFTFRLYSLGTFFDDCTIHWENEPHATCSASLKQFAEWTSGFTLTSSRSHYTAGDSGNSNSSCPQPPPPAGAAARSTCDQGHSEGSCRSAAPTPSSASSCLFSYDRREYTAYSSYNHLARTGHRADWSDASLDWTRLKIPGVKGNWTTTTLWIGTVGAYTPCHQDTYGYNAVVQVKGAKQWVLFCPSDRPYLYPCRLPYEESSIFSRVNILSPDLHRYPKYAHAHPYVVTLEPGDVLIIPPKWFHFVQCVKGEADTGVCMSVNAWQSIPSDRFDRVKESLVKFLATALIPTYEGLDNMCTVAAATTTTTTTTAQTRTRQHSSWLNTTVGGEGEEDVENVDTAEDAFHYVRVALNVTEGSTGWGSQSEEGHTLSSSIDDNPWMNLESAQQQSIQRAAVQVSRETLIWRLNDEKKCFLSTSSQLTEGNCGAQIVTKKRSREQEEEEDTAAADDDETVRACTMKRKTIQSTTTPTTVPLESDLDVRTVIETILDDQVIEVITRKLLQEKGEKEAPVQSQ